MSKSQIVFRIRNSIAREADGKQVGPIFPLSSLKGATHALVCRRGNNRSDNRDKENKAKLPFDADFHLFGRVHPDLIVIELESFAVEDLL